MLANLTGIKSPEAIKSKNALFSKVALSPVSAKNVKNLAESLINQ